VLQLNRHNSLPFPLGVRIRSICFLTPPCPVLRCGVSTPRFFESSAPMSSDSPHVRAIGVSKFFDLFSQCAFRVFFLYPLHLKKRGSAALCDILSTRVGFFFEWCPVIFLIRFFDMMASIFHSLLILMHTQGVKAYHPEDCRSE